MYYQGSYICVLYSFFFFFNDTATTEIYTLSLHDALPISTSSPPSRATPRWCTGRRRSSSCSGGSSPGSTRTSRSTARSEEHTSELQSRQYLVCRLLLEKKKTKKPKHHYNDPQS